MIWLGHLRLYRSQDFLLRLPRVSDRITATSFRERISSLPPPRQKHFSYCPYMYSGLGVGLGTESWTRAARIKSPMHYQLCYTEKYQDAELDLISSQIVIHRRLLFASCFVLPYTYNGNNFWAFFHLLESFLKFSYLVSAWGIRTPTVRNFKFRFSARLEYADKRKGRCPFQVISFWYS